MIHRELLTTELARQVTSLEDDLRTRADSTDEVRAVVEKEWQAAHDAGRTAHDLETWRESLLTQVAVAWVLATVFVRFCEDNGLLPEPVLSGPGERRRRAEDSQRAWFRDHPAEGERGYLTHTLEEAASLPGLGHVLESHNPLWLFGPSDDALRELLTYWREIDPETGELLRDFTDPEWGTRFLGDLYQDLSEQAKKQYALLQTPEFVEEFILDRTLDPAVEEFGLDGFRIIDPACGSGHFLLGSFDRLLDRWRDRAPQEGDRALAERALQSIHGVDLNPFAAAIARFRLLVAALYASRVRTLEEAPNFALNIAVGDSLLHGPPPGQGTLIEVEQSDPATGHLFATEDADVIHRMLERGYHAVVANPPYITPKDPAANQAYRRRYETCHMKYAMSVPFMERLFDLAVSAADGQRAGFVGQITANSFMKREFGKKLIEKYLATEVDVTHVIDTSGAYIPGHGTPTVILFGRNRKPVGGTVRAVLGIRGEPGRPDEPPRGEVWSSITELVGQPGAENDYVTVADLGRERLATHPWSLQGGGAVELKERLARGTTLGDLCASIGITAVTGEDDLYIIGTPADASRVGLTHVMPLVTGDLIRDWHPAEAPVGVWTYDERLKAELPMDAERWLWRGRTSISKRKRFGVPMLERGLYWWEWQELYADKLRTPMSISFAFVATHNHFVLDQGGKVFNRSAPVIKLPADTSKRDHLALLGLLNSAVACFWMKQVLHNKGSTVDKKGARQTTIAFENFYEFDGTKLKQFPIPEGSAVAWAVRADELARELAGQLPAGVAEQGTPSREALAEARDRVTMLRSSMVGVQEELDWRCLYLYGVIDEDLSLPPEGTPPINRGQRAFEIVLARRMAAGETELTWFERHGSVPITELPGHWPDEYRRLVERRIELIESNRFVGLVERPEYKRRWNWDRWEDLEQTTLRNWLLYRLEDPRYWPDTRPRSAAQLADDVRADSDFVQVAELYAGTVDVDITGLVTELVTSEAVPYLAAWRYKPAGLRKRAAWERTWELQRREDVGEDVANIPVPPRYNKSDFADNTYWRLRGKLDVPKERFIFYLGLGRDTDPTPLVGWAGWDHLRAAQALAALYEERRTVDGWDGERLIPLLAGLAELLPWLRQWHNDVDPATGTRLGDFFADYLRTECHHQGVAESDLADWRPPTTSRRGRRASR